MRVMTDRNVAMEEWVPRLRRDIEMVPTSYEGQRALLVRESLGLIREPFLLHGEILSFLSLIDGKRNIRDIQLDLIRLKKGAFVTSEEVIKILGDLDSIFLLEAICEGHVQKFWEEACRVNNRYNVCGLSCVATLMEIHPQRKGHLLGYELWEEEATQSAVSFAAVAIQR